MTVTAEDIEALKRESHDIKLNGYKKQRSGVILQLIYFGVFNGAAHLIEDKYLSAACAGISALMLIFALSLLMNAIRWKFDLTDITNEKS